MLPVGHCGEVFVVGDDHDGLAEPVAQVEEQAVDLVAVVRVEVCPRVRRPAARRGELIRARAMATRCCSPPESCPGLWSRRAGEAHHVEQLGGAAFDIRTRGRRPISPGMQTFSKAVNSGKQVVELEHEADALVAELRQGPIAQAPRHRGPSISTRPPSGRDSVPMICKSVVLPAPLAPTMETTSPRATSSETPFSTSSVPKLLCMSVARIIGGTY